VACAALDLLDRILAVGGTWDDGEPLRLAAPAPDIAVHARVIADLAGRPVRPVPGVFLAAAGACIQAAAVLREEPPEDIAAEWDLGAAELVEPADDPTRLARRIAHTEEQARQHRAVRARA
jgi:sugar (pentulose or hexulose) kinase